MEEPDHPDDVRTIGVYARMRGVRSEASVAAGAGTLSVQSRFGQQRSIQVWGSLVAHGICYHHLLSNGSLVHLVVCQAHIFAMIRCGIWSSH